MLSLRKDKPSPKAPEQHAPSEALRSRRNSEVWGHIKTLVTLLIIAVFLKGSVVEAYKIPSSSMVPTLHVGDLILVNKLSYGLRLPLVGETVLQYAEPTRGDVVVFTRSDNPNTPEVDESNTNFIKRVIGLPGDLVEVRKTTVYINGERFEDDSRYSRWVFGGTKNFGPVRVPEGHVLVLGDNRDQSRDSRAWEEGPFLEISRLKGRAFLIYWNWYLEFDRIFKVIS